MKRGEGCVEGLRVQGAQHPAEGVVAGDAVLERHELAQQLKSRFGEGGHLGAVDRSAQHGGQGHEQDVDQTVGRVVVAGVLDLLENVDDEHESLPSMRGSVRIDHHDKRNKPAYSHAISLPPAGAPFSRLTPFNFFGRNKAAKSSYLAGAVFSSAC